jgi:hypothetical protein
MFIGCFDSYTLTSNDISDKTIKGEDRIVLIGTSRCPFDGEMKPLTSTYQRLILIPRPDYASRHCKSQHN